jgi:hypothetical protein
MTLRLASARRNVAEAEREDARSEARRAIRIPSEEHMTGLLGAFYIFRLHQTFSAPNARRARRGDFIFSDTHKYYVQYTPYGI